MDFNKPMLLAMEIDSIVANLIFLQEHYDPVLDLDIFLNVHIGSLIQISQELKILAEQ